MVVRESLSVFIAHRSIPSAAAIRITPNDLVPEIPISSGATIFKTIASMVRLTSRIGGQGIELGRALRAFMFSFSKVCESGADGAVKTMHYGCVVTVQ
jgi:hypothetical protein